MKKICFFSIIFIFLAGAAWGQTSYVWVGTDGNHGGDGSTWIDEKNWEESGIPGVVAVDYPKDNDSITIPSGLSDYPTVPNTITSLGTVEINGGELTVEAGSDLEITNLNAAGGELVTTGADVTVITSADIDGAFTVTGDLDISGTTVIDGTLTITGTLNIIGAAGASGDINVTGLLAITSGASLTMGTHNLSVTSLTITGTLNAGVQITLNGGVWNRTGTFNHNSGTVIFNTGTTVNSVNTFNDVMCKGNVSFAGSNTFADLTCDSGAVVSFAGGSTQTINGNLTATGAVLTAAAPVSQWNITGLTAANFTSNASTNISYCRSGNYLARNASNAVDGGNNIRVFAGGAFTWTGAASTAWSNDANWTTYFPPVTDNTTVITIPDTSGASGRNPVLDAAVACGTLTVNTGAELDLGAYIMTVGTFANNGTIKLHGVSGQVTGTTLPATGTIHYYGNVAGGNQWIFGSSYTNLIIDGTAAMIPGGNLIADTAIISSNISAVSVRVDGTSTLNASINTTGEQSYTGVIVGNITPLPVLTSSANRVAASGIVSGAAGNTGLTVNALTGIDMSNTGNTLSGNIILNNNQSGTRQNEVSFYTSGAVTITVENPAAAGTNPGNVTITAGVITVEASGITAAGSVTLNSTTGAVTQSGIITAANITVSAVNGITLNGANQISTNADLTNNTANDVSFTNTSVNLGLTAVNNTRAISIYQTGNLSITSVISGSLSLNVSGAITAAGANVINTLRITRAGGSVDFNNSNALVIDGIDASNAGAGRNNVKITATGGITQTANLITNTGLLDITAAGPVLLPGTGNAAHSVDGLAINMSGGSGTIRFVNNLALAVQGITAANYSVEMINANPVNITGAVSANELRLQTNNTAAAADNNITIGASMTVTAKLAIICGIATGDPGSAADRCGTITFSSSANVTGSANSLVIEIEAGNVINNSSIIASSGNISFLLDNLTVYGTITAANITIAPRHGSVNLVYYSGMFSVSSPDTHFGNFLAVPAQGNDNKNFSGYNNVFLVNVNDAANRTVSINANGFIEFYTSTAYSNNSYIYTGANTDHLILNAVGIQSYHANGGQTNVNLGSSRFNIDENISIKNGSLSIAADVITLEGNVTSAAANTSANLAIINSGDFTLPAGANINLSGNFTQSGGGTSNLAADIITSGSSAEISFTNPVAVTGNVTLGTNNGTIKIKADVTVTAASARISFTSPVNLENNITFNAPYGGIVDLKQGTVPNANKLTLNGGSAGAPLEISRDSGTLDDVIVTAGSYAKVSSGKTISQVSAKTLVLERETAQGANNGAILDTSAGSWHMGGAGAPGEFTGIKGELELGTHSKLTVNLLNLQGSGFSVNNDDSAVISVMGNAARISEYANFTGDHPLLILEMAGSGLQNLTADQSLGSLHIGVNSQTVLNTDLAVKEIKIRGEVKILSLNTPAGLNAGNNDIIMYAGLSGKRDLTSYLHNGTSNIFYSRWEITGAQYIVQPPFNSMPNINNFVFRQNTGKKVSLKRDNSSTPVFFEIAGNTMWQELECYESGAVVQFSRNPDHHTIFEQFSMQGSPGGANHDNYVTLTRLTEGNYSSFPYLYDPSMAPPPSVIGVTGTYALPSYLPPMDLKNAAAAERNKYWNVNLLASPGILALDNFKYVKLFFSHAYNQRIPIESERMYLDVVPYYKAATNEGYFNFDWVELKKILYSFTEDSNGNGRLDRIRVQTNIRLNGIFNNFEVDVEGYEVNESKGKANGCELVSDITKSLDDEDSFYIYLKEKPEIDGGNTPLWRVKKNNDSLKDKLTESSLVGDPVLDINIVPFDTIPPRIAYSVTLPGHPKTYVRASEPVVSSSGDSAFDSFDGSNIDDATAVETSRGYNYLWQYLSTVSDEESKDYTLPVSPANLGYLLSLKNSLKVEDLVKLKDITPISPSVTDGYFTLNDMTDQGQRALDLSDPEVDPAYFLYYQPPKYPLNWRYTKYAKVFGNSHLKGKYTELAPDDSLAVDGDSNPIDKDKVFLPPNKMLTVDMMTTLADRDGDQITPDDFNAPNSVIRRITDVLVSIPPSGKDDRYFAWPVWARYDDTTRHPDITSPVNDFWKQQSTDSGIIWEFDGTKFLETKDVKLQARLNSSLTSGMDMDVYWAVNIGENYRNPRQAAARGRGTGGLWLPDLSDNPLYYYAPLSNGIKTANLFSNNSPLFTYNLNGFNSGEKVEFIFRLKDSTISGPDFFIARLDIPLGASIPDNWYRLVKPFGFDIQNVRLQRGGVTITNNVINSNNRENVYIRYNLLKAGRVTIQVYTLDGTLVKSIRRNEMREAGEWVDSWNGTNNGGRPVARGLYFVRVVAPDIDEIRKIMVVK